MCAPNANAPPITASMTRKLQPWSVEHHSLLVIGRSCIVVPVAQYPAAVEWAANVPGVLDEPVDLLGARVLWSGGGACDGGVGGDVICAAL
jgi:hypothetical protein